MNVVLTKQEAIEKAAKAVEALQKGFILDKLMPGRVVDANPDECTVTVEFQLTDDCLNLWGITHGGTTAWLCDLSMAVGIATYGNAVHGTTIDLAINYISPIPKCSKVQVVCKSIKIGGYIRRAEAKIYVNGQLVASSVGNYTGIKMAGDEMIKL